MYKQKMLAHKQVLKIFCLTFLVGVCSYVALVMLSDQRITSWHTLSFLDKGTLTYIAPWRKGQSMPIYDVCFIKTRKTASTTISSILNRFAMTNNLSLALMKTNKHSGHFNIIPIREDSPRKLFLPPLGVKPGDWTNYKYNMMTVHVRYNRSAFETFMNPATKYISILRETCSHFESDFVYYKIPAVVKSIKKNISIEETLQEYFRDPEFYWEKTKAKYGKTIMFFTRNVQAFDLGLDHIYHNDTDVLNTFIRKLEDEIDLMLITEYFDESLLLLKKLLRWDWKDVMYIARNMRPLNTTRATLTSDLCKKIKEWNSADNMLYQTFNKTLWRRVKAYGKDWKRDLDKMKRQLRETLSNCTVTTATKASGSRKQVVYKTQNSSFTLCKLLTEYNQDIIHRIMQRQSSGYYYLMDSQDPDSHKQKICGFEYRANCGFKFARENGYEWAFDQGLRIEDVTTNSTDGTFLVAQYKGNGNNDTKEKRRARVMIPEYLRNASQYCLSFYYYPSEDIIGRNFTLQVCLVPETTKARLANCVTVWEMMDTSVYFGKWNSVSLNITKNDNFTVQVAFEAVSGQFSTSKDTLSNFFIGLDDVSLQQDWPCQSQTREL
ncbi:galactose-3-O-sulfotransferase 3-like [Ptychodera flava]|uniref:galactose-3-O-sulfotransferase 3-like n=1 Tax=Ptychodera flava TaxID=63121 RepID=UPI003969E49B